MQGKRRDQEDDEALYMEPGEYGKTPDGKWWCRVPIEQGFGIVGLGLHTIVEHEDGTITVSPSILCYGHHDPDTGKPREWHGYLECGVWRKV